VRSVAVIPDSISRSVYIKECSGIMDIDEQVLHSETNKLRKKKYQEKYKREQFKQKQEKSPAIPDEEQALEGTEGQVQEKEVIRLLVAYGMSVFASEENEEGEWEDTLVAEYIIGEITHDELRFSFPLYQKIFEEYQQKYGQEGQVGAQHFIHHPDDAVSSLCADLLSPKYKESKYWKRNGNVYETEEDRLNQVVRDGVLAFKNLKIQELIKQAEKDLVAAQEKQDPEEINTCYQNFVALTRLKMELAKNLGERTIVR
jgi:DNA primase